MSVQTPAHRKTGDRQYTKILIKHHEKLNKEDINGTLQTMTSSGQSFYTRAHI